MMLVSVLADHAALRLTERTQIHASAGRLWNACDEANARHGFVRTLCGVDAKLIGHGLIGRPDDVMIADWPPPVLDRCPDCARLTGVDGRQRNGSAHWQKVVPVDQADEMLSESTGGAA